VKKPRRLFSLVLEAAADEPCSVPAGRFGFEVFEVFLSRAQGWEPPSALRRAMTYAGLPCLPDGLRVLTLPLSRAFRSRGGAWLEAWLVEARATSTAARQRVARRWNVSLLETVLDPGEAT
jgi:hypothetical protein